MQLQHVPAFLFSISSVMKTEASPLRSAMKKNFGAFHTSTSGKRFASKCAAAAFLPLLMSPFHLSGLIVEPCSDDRHCEEKGSKTSLNAIVSHGRRRVPTAINIGKVDIFDDQDEEGGGGDDVRFQSNRPHEQFTQFSLGDNDDSDFEDHIPKLNIVTLVGRVGQTPEPWYFDDGKVVVNLSLAVKRKYHPLERQAYGIQYGEEPTDWFSLEIWGRDAEFVSRFVTKGARIGVTGSLVIDSWIDKGTGEEREKPKIQVNELDILESRAEADLRQKNQRVRGQAANYVSGVDSVENDVDEGAGYSSAGSGGFFD